MLARLSLKWKLMALVIFIVTLSTYLLGRMMNRGLYDLLSATAGLRAETVADTVGGLVESSWFEPGTDYAADTQFQEVQGELTRLLAKNYISRVQFVRLVGAQQAENMLNLPDDGSADYYPPGHREETPVGSLYSQRTEGHAYVEFSSGFHMAGWVPIRQKGKVTGLVLIYVDANDIQDALNTTSLAILLTATTLVLSAAYITYKFAATFEKAAVTDGLMGIYNHKFFKQRLEQEVAKSGRYGTQTSLVLLDIDFFKRVNDTYGHATGDIVLKNLAKIVSDTSRNTDVVARYGGEEVAVVLTHTGLAGAQEFAERLRLRVAQHVVRDPEEEAEFRVTVSIGVAQWEKGVDMISLIKRADAALYHSKRTGRNRVTIYQEEILPDPDTQQQ
jgi:diguanylate cyclase (GGDEF)-like protein